MDYNWAMIYSTCLTFNKFSVLQYLQNCCEFVSDTVPHLCSAHVMHMISYNIDKKFKVDAKLKRVILHVQWSLPKRTLREADNPSTTDKYF